MKTFFDWLLVLIDGPELPQEVIKTPRPQRKNKINGETGCTCALESEWQEDCPHNRY